jgi:hypothetical protein
MLMKFNIKTDILFNKLENKVNIIKIKIFIKIKFLIVFNLKIFMYFAEFKNVL